jgi:pyridoxamine 5'-phosphate oxidase
MEIYNDLLPDPLPTEPMALAGAWLATALAARQQPNPDAMVLATATADGQPSARIVLCKELDPEYGRVSFVTNYDSRKGREIGQNARAALVFHWDHAHRQVRIEGVVVKAPATESDA